MLPKEKLGRFLAVHTTYTEAAEREALLGLGSLIDSNHPMTKFRADLEAHNVRFRAAQKAWTTLSRES